MGILEVALGAGLGLYDLDRNIMPVGRAYQKLIQQWRDVLSAEAMDFISGMM
jgi:hypothetical protein